MGHGAVEEGKGIAQENHSLRCIKRLESEVKTEEGPHLCCPICWPLGTTGY